MLNTYLKEYLVSGLALTKLPFLSLGRQEITFQINLGKFKTVTAVATQGRNRGVQYVKTYRLAFSRQEGEWFYYKENGKVKVSQGGQICSCALSSYVGKTNVSRCSHTRTRALGQRKCYLQKFTQLRAFKSIQDTYNLLNI